MSLGVFLSARPRIRGASLTSTASSCECVQMFSTLRAGMMRILKAACRQRNQTETKEQPGKNKKTWRDPDDVFAWCGQVSECVCVSPSHEHNQDTDAPGEPPRLIWHLCGAHVVTVWTAGHAGDVLQRCECDGGWLRLVHRHGLSLYAADRRRLTNWDSEWGEQVIILTGSY